MTGMARDEDGFVWVRRQSNGSVAKYRREDFSGAHWSQTSGGRGETQSRLFIFGYVMCDSAIEGEVGHSGTHGPCPHRIKVCVVAKDNTEFTMALVHRMAGQPPPAADSAADRVLTALEDAGGELVNVDLWVQARLSKAHGQEVLDRLVRRGAITRDYRKVPNRAGVDQRQLVWTLHFGACDPVVT